MRLALEAEPGNPMAMGILTFYAITTANEAAARDWLDQVSHQPRVPADQRAKLTDAYRRQFGHEWKANAARP